MWYQTHVLPLQFQYATLSYHIFKNKYNHTQSILRKSPIVSLNFCTIWKVNSDFYLLATLGMFGNCFFPLFSVFKKKKNLFIKLKNLFGNPKWIENKKWFLKLNLWKKLKICKRLSSISSFQNLMKTRI